jgi:hypothetical protein
MNGLKLSFAPCPHISNGFSQFEFGLTKSWNQTPSLVSGLAKKSKNRTKLNFGSTRPRYCAAYGPYLLVGLLICLRVHWRFQAGCGMAALPVLGSHLSVGNCMKEGIGGVPLTRLRCRPCHSFAFGHSVCGWVEPRRPHWPRCPCPCPRRLLSSLSSLSLSAISRVSVLCCVAGCPLLSFSMLVSRK